MGGLRLAIARIGLGRRVRLRIGHVYRRAGILAQDAFDAFGGSDDLVGPELQDRRLLRSDLTRDRALTRNL